MIFLDPKIEEYYLNELKEDIKNIQKRCEDFKTGKEHPFQLKHPYDNGKIRQSKDSLIESFDSSRLIKYIDALIKKDIDYKPARLIQQEFFNYLLLKMKSKKIGYNWLRLHTDMSISYNTFNNYIYENALPVKCIISLLDNGYLSIGELLFLLKINGIDFNGLRKELIELQGKISNIIE
ncbi:MAG: hypothetical protein IJ889_05830 [Eubacterium sp.]|nr:hypothetical protein [Eubacterium sp.]